MVSTMIKERKTNTEESNGIRRKKQIQLSINFHLVDLF